MTRPILYRCRSVERRIRLLGKWIANRKAYRDEHDVCSIIVLERARAEAATIPYIQVELPFTKLLSA